jgi:hypothetical protein
MMLLCHLKEAPTAVEALAMEGMNVSEEDRVASARAALYGFERRWKVDSKPDCVSFEVLK